ncbi:type II toxin-antitoxin system Phd/YefM family antitoxin [Nocardiopsis sp. CNT-189]|uniref:type II toxin-antitoxin system Phd/YefM family antitoxin n=1 Tax=Nocardiopsis oceanisediminis TaxID=2816862 RepID=UPI003B2E476A
MHWQVQEAKQRFSALLRSAQTDGPQFVTRHGEDVAVVIDVEEYRHLRGQERDFKDFLLDSPDWDDFADVFDEVVAERDLPRQVDLGTATEEP